MPFSATRNVTAKYSAIESWGYDKFIGEAAARQVVPTLEYFLNDLPRNARLLDVGCGGGHLLLELADGYPEMKLSGVDLCPNQVRRAQSRSNQFGGRVEVAEASALDLPHADSAFDAVLSITSIKHWPDQRAGALELLRVLKPGGRLHLVEVFADCTLDDVRAFLATLPVPRLLHPVAAPQMRKLLQTGWTLEHARELANSLDLDDVVIERPPGPPALVVSGTKPR